MNKSRTEAFFELVRTLLGVLVALLIAFIIIFFVSKEPLTSLKSFILGPISSLRRFSNVFEMSLPLIFTGLAVCVMFKANQFNMLGEGCFFFGGIIAAIIAIKVILPIGAHPLIAILAGGLAGAAASIVPALLKAKWGANEFVTSLMFNYVLYYFGKYLLNALIRDPKAGSIVSFEFNNSAKLPTIVPGTRIHLGILIAIIMIIVVYYFLFRTKWGYWLRITGLNIKFAEYSGISAFAVIMYSQIIGGFIAGVGGATEVLGMYNRFQWSALPGYGFDGIIVAIIARQNPKYVPISAIFLAYLRIGADIMSRMNDVPSEVIAIIQSIMIILIAANGFLATWRHRIVVNQSNKKLAVKGEI